MSGKIASNGGTLAKENILEFLKHSYQNIEILKLLIGCASVPEHFAMTLNKMQFIYQCYCIQ